jgi:hypothetical protein
MNVDAVNLDPTLHYTPLGRLSVHHAGGGLNVVLDDGHTRPRIVHVLEEGDSVFDALYGKNALLAREAQRRYAARDDDKKRAELEAEERESRWFRANLVRMLRRDREGTLAAMAQAVNVPGSR